MSVANKMKKKKKYENQIDTLALISLPRRTEIQMRENNLMNWRKNQKTKKKNKKFSQWLCVVINKTRRSQDEAKAQGTKQRNSRTLKIGNNLLIYAQRTAVY